MKSWDLLLVAAIILASIAAGAVDWRLGAAVLSVALAAVWYWLGEVKTDAPD